MLLDMRPQILGALTVQSVLETACIPLRLADFLPASTAEAIDAEREWLEPRFARLDRGLGFLRFHSYLVRSTHHNILIDCCVGNDKHRPAMAEFHQLKTSWLDNLRACGVTPEQIDYVLCTHMHSDHVGWNTRLQDGRWVPTFPNARYIFARDEFAHRERLHRQNLADGYGAFADSVLPVVASGQALLVDSDFALDDCVRLAPAAGHTPGNVVIHLCADGAAAVLSGDVMHHPLQVAHPEWSSAFCEDPALSAAYRRSFLDSHADTNTLILPAHFPAPTAGRIRRAGTRLRYDFIDS